jgi:hypothetical protein
MESSNAKVPNVQPPRREGVSKRGILVIALLVSIFYVANWISTKPLTRRPNLPNLATPTFVATHRAARAPSEAPAEDAPGARWCIEYGGVFERFSPYIEICHFPVFANSSSR